MGIRRQVEIIYHYMHIKNAYKVYVTIVIMKTTRYGVSCRRLKRDMNIKNKVKKILSRFLPLPARTSYRINNDLMQCILSLQNDVRRMKLDVKEINMNLSKTSVNVKVNEDLTESIIPLPINVDANSKKNSQEYKKPSYKKNFDLNFQTNFDYVPDILFNWTKSYLTGKSSSILDFGCGNGIAALRLAIEDSSSVVYGCDVTQAFSILEALAFKNLEIEELPKNLYFQQISGVGIPFEPAQFDLIYSWSVFEHIDINIMDEVIVDIRKRLKNDGVLFIQIDPLYYSAKGSHLIHLQNVPWIHLIKQHNHLKETFFKTDDSNTQVNLSKEFFWDEYKKLNKITVDSLIGKFEKHGFCVVRKQLMKCDTPIPEFLQNVYQVDALRTYGVILLLQKEGNLGMSSP